MRYEYVSRKFRQVVPTNFLIAAGAVIDVFSFHVIFAGMLMLTISAATVAINPPKPKFSYSVGQSRM